MKNLYWGYIDDTGIVHVKRYTGDRIIENTEKLPFCKGIFDPFYATNYQEAKIKVMQCYAEEILRN